MNPLIEENFTERGDAAPPGSCCGGAVLYRNLYLLLTPDRIGGPMQLRCFTGRKWSVVPIQGWQPPGTLTHSVNLWSDRGKDYLYLYGGMTNVECMTSVYRLRLDTGQLGTSGGAPFSQYSECWENVTPKFSAPSPRRGHSAVVYGNRLYVFMGAALDGTCADDVHYLDLHDHTWHVVRTTTLAGPPIAGRTGQSAVLHDDKVYLFGGMSCEKTRVWQNDLWAFHLDTGVWEQVHAGSRSPQRTVPAERYSHVAWVSGADHPHMYIFGGDTENCTKYFNDMWRWDFNSRAWEQVFPWGDQISQRSGCAAAAAGNRCLIFGGEFEVRKGDVDTSNALFTVYCDTTCENAAAKWLAAAVVADAGTELRSRIGEASSYVSSLRVILRNLDGQKPVSGCGAASRLRATRKRNRGGQWSQRKN